MLNQTPIERRGFLRHAGAAALGAVGSAGTPILQAASSQASSSESLVKILSDSLTDWQRETICFPWDHVDRKRGLLRTRIENSWRITKPSVASNFYSADQRALILAIFRGMTNPEWHSRFDQQLRDDLGGFGRRQSIAILGEPGSGPSQFVITSRHMTMRCDGDSAEHVAFGGPILYAHGGLSHLFEKPEHKNNVFWHQAVEANKLYGVLDSRHQEKALVKRGMPSEDKVGFKGRNGDFQGCPVADFSSDQKAELQRIVRTLTEPFRNSDREEVVRCLQAQGGLDHCHLAFYEQGDIGRDKVYDNWRLEGPSFVWYFRGRPHVHVWVNVADDPSVALNASENSKGVALTL